jgi:hypothetical protein
MRKQHGEWFPHDARSSADEKMVMLISVYGHKGYGWFWRIIEMMRTQTKYAISLKSKHAMKGLADILRSTDVEVSKFIKDCTEEFRGADGIGLFSTDGESFWSDSLRERMERLDEIRHMRSEFGKEGSKKRWQKADEEEAKAISFLSSQDVIREEVRGDQLNMDGKGQEEKWQTITRREEKRREEKRIEEKRKDKKVNTKTKTVRVKNSSADTATDLQLLFQVWNAQPKPVMQCIKVTPIIKKQFEKCFKRNGGDADAMQLMNQAVKNYGMVLSSPDEYFFQYRWTLQEFLTRENAMAMFGIPEEECKAKFRKREQSKMTGDEVVIENSADFNGFQSYLSSNGLKADKYWTSGDIKKTGDGKFVSVKIKGAGIARHWNNYLMRKRR